MSALSNDLDRLLSWLESIGLHPPSQDVRIVEVSADEVKLDDGKYHIRRDELCRPSDYEPRFDELLQAGYPWINMSCFGTYDSYLIVAIELPSPSPLRPGLPTSVNLSGPARTVLDHSWCVDPKLAVE